VLVFYLQIKNALHFARANVDRRRARSRLPGSTAEADG
jgi:hypothetical protein